MTTKEKERPLSDEELRQVRELIERDKRVSWIWTTIRTFAVWISATVLGVSVGFEALSKFVKYLGK